MFNNEVTYDDKWNTPENRKALEKLQKKFFDKSYAYPDCPVGWAPEVLELLETLEKEFGFEYNTGTMQSYFIQGGALNHFLIDPFKGLYHAVRFNFIDKPVESWEIKNRNKPLFERLKKVLDGFIHPISYGIRAFRIIRINPILNKIKKPKLRLDQVKEKYGTLRIYFSSPDYLEEYVEKLIAQCEVKLAMKGCYYPLESLWGYGVGWNCGTESRPDIFTTKEDTYSDGEKFISVTKTTHRQAMKDLGIDIKDMETRHQTYLANRSKQNF